jgi:hypothetical protein
MDLLDVLIMMIAEQYGLSVTFLVSHVWIWNTHKLSHSTSRTTGTGILGVSLTYASSYAKLSTPLDFNPFLQHGPVMAQWPHNLT